MSASYVGSDALTNPVTAPAVPGLDVLDPAAYAASPKSPAAANPAGSSGLNQYQQALANLSQWQAQILQQSLFGDTAGATSALYASAGLSADQFAKLASELQNIQASGTAGSIVNTAA